jgi:hypothetical protein
VPEADEPARSRERATSVGDEVAVLRDEVDDLLPQYEVPAVSQTGNWLTGTMSLISPSAVTSTQ